MTIEKVRKHEEGPFDIHQELAGLVPMASDAEQAVLTEDIRATKQREAIVLWRGKVVDGRCRMQALMLIGRDIHYKELDDALTEDEVRVYVKSVNTRRNLSATQKIMSACRASLAKGNNMKIGVMAKSWGISATILKNARYIAKNEPDMVQPLFDGKTVILVGSDGRETASNKISAIYASVVRIQQNAKEDVAHGWKEDGIIKTQAGKDWYYTQVKIADTVGAGKYKELIAELANYKFVADGK